LGRFGVGIQNVASIIALALMPGKLMLTRCEFGELNNVAP